LTQKGLSENFRPSSDCSNSVSCRFSGKSTDEWYPAHIIVYFAYHLRWNSNLSGKFPPTSCRTNSRLKIQFRHGFIAHMNFQNYLYHIDWIPSRGASEVATLSEPLIDGATFTLRASTCCCRQVFTCPWLMASGQICTSRSINCRNEHFVSGSGLWFHLSLSRRLNPDGFENSGSLNWQQSFRLSDDTVLINQRKVGPSVWVSSLGILVMCNRCEMSPVSSVWVRARKV